MRHFLFTLLLIVSVVLVVDAGDPPVAPPPRLIPIGELVRQLGSDDPREREAATKRLAALGLDTPPKELVEATRSDDPEVRERARQAVDAIRRRAAGRQLDRDRRFADRGAIDLYVTRSALWDVKADDARVWDTVLAIGRDLFKRADVPIEFGNPARLRDLAAYRAYCNPRFVRTEGSHTIDGKDVNGKELSFFPEGIMAGEVTSKRAVGLCLVLSRGGVTPGGCIKSSIVFATGSVASGDYIHKSLIVCDGNVDVQQEVTDSVVIARGNIQVNGWAADSVLIAGGKVTIRRQATAEGRLMIKENEPKPLGFITFFELSQVGVEAAEKDMVVRLTKLTDASPLRKAGVAAGDVVLKVDGKLVATPEELRRALRDATATTGAAVLVLRRGEKESTVRVPLPD